jgi:hypothetical protein
MVCAKAQVDGKASTTDAGIISNSDSILRSRIRSGVDFPASPSSLLNMEKEISPFWELFLVLPGPPAFPHKPKKSSSRFSFGRKEFSP